MPKIHDVAYDPSQEPYCRCFCGEDIMEAVYTGGWMHKKKEDHAHLPFVYSDGVIMSIATVGYPGFCILCGTSLN